MAERDTSRDVAIIGMACRFAGADSPDELWALLRDGRDAFKPVPADRWDHDAFTTDRFRENDKTYVRAAGFIDDVDSFPAMWFGVAPRRLEVMDPQHRMALEVTRRALEDAGWGRAIGAESVGTFLGVSTSEYKTLVTSRSAAMMMAGGRLGDVDDVGTLAHAVENVSPISAFSMPGNLLNMAAANIAGQWGFDGPAYTVDAACASSLVAVHDAVMHIRAGQCDAAIAGGVYLTLTPEAIIGFSRIGAISQKGACRPFDADADGFMQGEGCGIVVLKSYDRAVEDGDRIHAVIRGCGVNNDAGTSTGPMAPSLQGQVGALRRAYRDADVDPSSVQFVSCHGTATPVGDPVEVGGLKDVVGTSGEPVLLGSVKGNIGHTMSAAGVAGLMHAILAMRERTVPPQAGFETPHAALEIEGTRFRVPTEPTEWPSTEGPRRAGVSAFGFGGTNCHVVLEEPPQEGAADPGSLLPETVLLSAGNRALLAVHCDATAEAIAGSDARFVDIVHTLNRTRGVENARLAVVANDAQDLLQKLRTASRLLSSPECSEGALGPDSFWGTGSDTPDVAFLFPGQGAQRVGLVSDLYLRYPDFAASLRARAEAAGVAIDELLYPADPDAAAEERLERTENCQPVMAALGLALADFLETLGLEPSVALGHSLGEFVAAGAVGLLGPDEAMRFVAERGRAMAQLDVDDFGAMAAVRAGREEVEPLLGDDVCLANLNHPTQTVISGGTEAVDATGRKLVDAGYEVTPLRVSHAFHSPVVSPVRERLATLALDLDFAEPRVPLVSAITNAAYDIESAAATFVDHTTSPVDFVSALRTASELGATVFLEVGAGSTLTSFARKTLGDGVVTRSVSGREPSDGRDFHRTLAALFALGVPVRFDVISPHGRLTSLPATPLETSKHWVIRDKKVPLSLPDVAPRQGEPVAIDSRAPSPELVALFKEQTEILRQHAAIIAAQTALLAGENVVPPTVVPQASPAAPAAEVPSKTEVEEPQPTLEPDAHAASEDLTALVYDAVAAVSAFPTDALQADQELAADLGFDSLMFVDLGAELSRRIPGLQIPRDAFGQRTSIADLVTFLESRDRPAASADGAAVEQAESALQAYEVVWHPAPARSFPGVTPARLGNVLVAGPEGRADEVRRVLEGEGVRADLKKGGAKSAETVVWVSEPVWNIDRLVEIFELARDMGAGRLALVSATGDDPAVIGAQRGFAKALARERGMNVVAIETDDFAHVASELLACTDDREVRYARGTRMIPYCEAGPALDKTFEIGEDDIVAITGGARGIGADCARAILAATPARVVLIGRSPADSAQTLLDELGDRASYLQWDVTEARPDAFGDRQPSIVLHAAGVIRDALLEEKSAEDVRTVVSVKVEGLRNLLDAAGDPRLAVGFGSWSGRFGNARQTDYAAANDAMNELLVAMDGRGLAIDWPIWSGSEMASTIPEQVQKMMRGEGVTFIETAEGTDALIELMTSGRRGEVILGRSLDPTTSRAFRFTASLDAMPYVADHVLRDEPLVPMAAALDWMSTAASWLSPATSVSLGDVQLFRGIELDEPREIEVDAAWRDGAVQVEVTSDGVLAYRAVATFGETELTLPERTGDAVTATLDLEQFYERHSFHGPQIRGIEAIDGVAPEWVVGTVRQSRPDDLGVAAAGWTADPLVVDASMQLVLYHLRSLHGFGAFPTAIDRYTQLRPFEGKTVRCTMALDEMADGDIVGTIGFEDDRGLAALMTRLRAKEFDAPKNDDAQPVAEIDPRFWKIGEFEEVKELEQRLQMADLIGIRNPYFWSHTGPARNTAIVDGKKMINFSSYNYCGFSGHPDVSSAAQQAITDYGTSVSASRIASGQIPLHQELEDAIAQFIGTEASLVFAAGHMTNETCIGHLFGKNDLIIHDSLAHNSILTGAELSGAKRMQFPHSDYEALDRILTKIRGSYQKVGIFIEGVYSMDGDIPDLASFIRVKKKHRCLLYVDEAHSIGVIGERGAGISDYFGIDPMEVDVWMGTLSKSFASCGGYITGSKQLIEYLKYTAPAFVFSAGISPANAAAALAAVRLLSENPQVPQTLQARADFFLERCNALGLDTGMSKDSAVVPVIVGNSLDCLKLSAQLAERGINVQPIVYPAVEDESSRLRFFLSAVHTEDELAQTAETVAEELANVRSGAAAE